MLRKTFIQTLSQHRLETAMSRGGTEDEYYNKMNTDN